MKVRIADVIKQARQVKDLSELIQWLQSINYISLYQAAKRLKTSYRVIKKIIQAEGIEVRESTLLKNQFILIKEDDIIKIQKVLKRYQWSREDD